MATRTSMLASQFTESVIRRSTVWSHQYRAVNLAQGFPEDDAPEELKARAVEAIRSGRNQYSDTWGTTGLREAIALKMNRLYDVNVVGAENVTVTCGATEAMQASLLAVVNRGDEVILFEPSYENFHAQILIAGGRPIAVPLVGADYELDRDRLTDAFTERTAAIIVNNPNNPCGKVFSTEELKFIAGLCDRRGVVAIADEVYEHMVYDDLVHRCLATVPGFGNDWIVISSCSKTYHVTGWRIGYAVAPASLTLAIRRCHDFLSGVAATPFQDAAEVALGFDASYYQWLRDHYRGKRSLMTDVLNGVGLSCSPPQGAYYILADMKQFDFEDSVEFCKYLLREIGVAAVPWTSFYSAPEHGRTRLRFTFSKLEETIIEAGKRLERLADTPRERVPVRHD